MISSDERLTLDPMRFEREDPAGSPLWRTRRAGLADIVCGASDRGT